MKKWNCVLKFSDHVPTELRDQRKSLVFGYLVGAWKATKARCKKEAPLLSDLQYVPGLLDMDTKSYAIGTRLDYRYVIFPKQKIFIPDLRNKHVFRCFVKLIVQHKMVQYRRPFLHLANEREIAKNERSGHTRKDMRFQRYGKLKGYVIEKRVPRVPEWRKLGFIKPYRYSYNKWILRWYYRPELQEVFHNPMYIPRQITKIDIEVLWKWLKVGKFTDEEITEALVDRFGSEVSAWIDKAKDLNRQRT